jgi:hypothetical protein
MKKLIVFSALFFLSAALFAQDCSKFLYMQKGKVIESSTYSDGKFVRKSVQTVMSVTTVNGVMTAQISAGPPTDKPKDKLMITLHCNGGVLAMEINSGNSPGSQDIKMNYEEYPGNMNTGDHLKDVNNKFTNKMDGKTYTGTSDITNRVVVAKENVTTPAGTFSCFKITFKITTAYNEPIEGVKVPPIVDSFTEWYCPQYGIVIKQDMGEGAYSEITSIK